jgi:hypothetical protein
MTRRRPGKQLRESHEISKGRQAEQECRLSCKDDCNIWRKLREAESLGDFRMEGQRGELVWSDETYRILGFTRGTNPASISYFDGSCAARFDGGRIHLRTVQIQFHFHPPPSAL